MLTNFRTSCQTNLITIAFALLALLLVREESLANETLTSVDHPWIACECSAPSLQAQILQDSRRSYDPNRPTFVITHGMGGTKAGDRFHQLADAICKAMPECNVLIIDWSKQSWRTLWFGLPDPLAVSRNIDPVALEASAFLKAIQIDPARTTFIGESFGNCVNAQIAKTFDGQGRILAFNPANELGGYRTPDLTTCSEVAWSFQTYSVFDTQVSIADVSIFLETTPMATEREQHIAGVSWLSERVRAGDLAWLLTLHNIPGHQAEHFDAIGTLSGELLHQYVPRQRPVPAEMNSTPDVSMLASTAGSGIQD